MFIRATPYFILFAMLRVATVHAQDASTPVSQEQRTQQPATAPIVVVEPMPGVPPNSIVVQQSTPLGYTAYYRNIERAEPIWPNAGMRVSFTGGFESHSRLLGATGALRYRASSVFALDIGAGYLVGSDDQHDDRREIPVFVDGLLYIIPRQPLHLYVVGGLHGAFAQAKGTRSDNSVYENLDGFYLGGQAGLGLELRLHPFVYIVTDVRGAMRTLVDGPSNLNFVEYDAQGNPTSTSNDWVAGLVFNAGLLFYF